MKLSCSWLVCDAGVLHYFSINDLLEYFIFLVSLLYVFQVVYHFFPRWASSFILFFSLACGKMKCLWSLFLAFWFFFLAFKFLLLFSINIILFFFLLAANYIFGYDAFHLEWGFFFWFSFGRKPVKPKLFLGIDMLSFR